jgi:UDP-N-acetyl-2-amino-2-deoxyglucuronate dehydrogenase
MKTDISTRRADDLIAATDRAGVTLGVMFQDRVKPGIRQLREWINTGVVGKPLLVDARMK